MKKALSALLCLALLTGCAGRSGRDLPLGSRISNCEQVVAGIRSGLRDHARTITVTFAYGSDIYSELNGVIDAWVEAALEETDDPLEGDYLRYQYGGYTYTSSYQIRDGRWHYTVTITPEYYCRLSQARQAEEEIAARVKAFAFTRQTTDSEKIRTIYESLCQSVRYDKVHRKNPYYHLCSTAYAALIQKTATCQGYCTALYGLLRAAGIRCRIVTGAAGGERGELHAWVIAELDGMYYGLDPTWDAGATEYRYFLRGESGFADHVPGARFTAEEFTARYPLAEADYLNAAA